MGKCTSLTLDETAYPYHLRALGDHLRKRRLDLGLLQKEVTVKLRVNESTITNWEINNNFPRFRFVPKIFEFLDYWPNDTKTENLGHQIVAVRKRLGLNQNVVG